MSITKNLFSQYIKAFQFRELFNEMGWNNDRTKHTIIIDGAAYSLSGVAEKSGFHIFTCQPQEGEKIPDNITRKKIENKITKLFQEHLIIFIDEKMKDQIWQLAVRKAGNPVKISETYYTISKDPGLLYQRAGGLFFTLDEEEKVTIIDVTKRVAENFRQNNEKVTKKFYERFKKEHTAFLKFIKGINDKMSMDWYASLMLNRLMFCYFIQKKGFLDNNLNYLQDKLKICKEKKGKNKFFSFYRNFLLALFHKGLGAPEHTKNLEVEIGKIPYLNGGLFDEHELEKTFEKIEIDDKAFEKLFVFFDEYEWHLDTRVAAKGNEINPDVIGYIFEKYINDRAQMGAYYTKEDITDYISKNCIIPWLFDEVKRKYPKAFIGDSWLYRLIKNSGDDYIYDAVKYGIPENGDILTDLPEEILKGFNPELEKKVVDGAGPYLHELRKEWNKPAPPEIALPTEIYREVIERRKRYTEIKDKISSGEVNQINDFITYNLNIRQFAQDVIETTPDPEFIRHFYKALAGISILDPTCGSGAFLFAALNILEPLYEACIRRMNSFISIDGRGRHKFFEEILAMANVPEHPNLEYFIYKSIILNNLYGVDIMNEAVEIAKLRLFLKLVANVEADYRKPNLGLEPLPDVDFNIRSGNTLVGYATFGQINNISGLFVTDAHKKKILEQCEIVARAFGRYKEIQISNKNDFNNFKKAKDELNVRLKKLTNDLDEILYMEQYKGHHINTKEYSGWLFTHQPFHWLAEFYEIIHDKNGFDVIIGNPPYVVYNEKKVNYLLKNYKSIDCKNLYTFIIERAMIISKNNNLGFIIPSAAFGTPSTKSLRNILLEKKSNYYISYLSGDAHPAILFEGVKLRLSILISNSFLSSQYDIYTTKLMKWYSEERSFLFEAKFHYKISTKYLLETFPKINYENEKTIFSKINCHKYKISSSISQKVSKHFLFYHNAPVFFIRAMNFTPIFESENSDIQSSNHFKTIYLNNQESMIFLLSVLNSSTFFIWFTNYSANRDLTSFDIHHYPIFKELSEIKNILDFLMKLNNELMKDLKNHSIIREYNYSTGKIKYQEFYMRLSKPIIDQIDCVLAEHYGFTHEELDFIINYDIKYRMGKELGEGEDV